MNGRRTRGLAGAAVGVLVAGLLAGCTVGVSPDAAPRIIGKKDVPYGLLDRSPPTTTSPAGSQFVTIYLEGRKRLVASSRGVAVPVTLAGIVATLGDGPTSSQAANGLTSPISTAAPISLVRFSRGVATVSVGKTFTTLAAQDQEIAVAQVVYTLTAYPGVSGVQIRIGKKPAKVPTAKGTLSGGPLVRDDYATLAPL